MKGRREKILEAALVLFNSNGIDAVTTRDIAKKTKISQGNLTYHFPAKNDIVLALVQEAGKAIDEALASQKSGSNSLIVIYYHQVETIFRTHMKYRFLFGRWGEIISSSKEIQSFAQGFLKVRFDQWHGLNQELVRQKLAHTSLIEESHGHSYVINMLALFWHQEFMMYFPNLTDQQKIKKALTIFFQSYKPYLTKKGWEQLSPFLEKLEHY